MNDELLAHVPPLSFIHHFAFIIAAFPACS
jgi:hypothetical protein